MRIDFFPRFFFPFFFRHRRQIACYFIFSFSLARLITGGGCFQINVISTSE